MLKTPELRQIEHFYWLAGHHVLGWSQNIIAKTAAVNRFAVQYAVKSLSSILDLTTCSDRPKVLRSVEHKRQCNEIARLLSGLANAAAR
jgi:hypothetical protein